MESKCDQSYWFWSGRVRQFKPDTWLSYCTKPESKVYQFINRKYSYQKLNIEIINFLASQLTEL